MKSATNRKDHCALCTCCLHAFAGHFNSFYSATDHYLSRTVEIGSHHYLSSFFLNSIANGNYFVVIQSKYRCHSRGLCLAGFLHSLGPDGYKLECVVKTQYPVRNKR